MPQLARSMNWHRVLAVEAFKSFLLMFVSLFLQVPRALSRALDDGYSQ